MKYLVHWSVGAIGSSLALSLVYRIFPSTREAFEILGAQLVFLIPVAIIIIVLLRNQQRSGGNQGGGNNPGGYQGRN